MEEKYLSHRRGSDAHSDVNVQLPTSVTSAPLFKEEESRRPRIGEEHVKGISNDIVANFA